VGCCGFHPFGVGFRSVSGWADFYPCHILLSPVVGALGFGLLVFGSGFGHSGGDEVVLLPSVWIGGVSVKGGVAGGDVE
jgi:hypothetical protein